MLKEHSTLGLGIRTRAHFAVVVGLGAAMNIVEIAHFFLDIL